MIESGNLSSRQANPACAFFERWNTQFDWHRTQAGSTALNSWKIPSVNAVTEELTRNESILIHPATTPGTDDQHMRMGFGRMVFPEALRRFEDWLERAT